MPAEMSDVEGDHSSGSSGRKKSKRKLDISQKKRAKGGELQSSEEEDMPLKLTKDLKLNSSKKKDKKKKSSLREVEDSEPKPAQRTDKKKKKKKKVTPSSRRKREEDSQSEEEGPAKRQAKTRDVSFRLLVPSRKLGKVIGKQGSHIQQLREATGAYIKIGGTINNVDERVVSISSKEETFESQSAAERALLRVVTILFEPETETAAAKVRLLIAGSQAGSVIGKAGVAINEMRDSSAANICILTKERFPLCAFASETDRLVQIEGEISQVQKALELIVVRLRESPPYQVDVKPRVGVTSGGASKASVEINIRSDLIGKLIGKNGVNIKQIRQSCGALVKVNESEDSAQVGTVLLTGTLSQVITAQTLMQDFLARQKAG